jgi:hypothetical protein
LRKELEFRSLIDKYILENITELSREDIHYKWKEAVENIKQINNLSCDIDNDYVCRRFTCIKNKIKRGKTIEELVNPVPLLPLKERKKNYTKKFNQSEKGKILREKYKTFKKDTNYYQINKEILSKKAKEYRKNNIIREKERARINQIKFYGITPEDYNKMFEEQNGCCCICNKHQSNFKKSLSIDHNHQTGKVRGLLCHHCNVGLGHFKDNIESLNSALDYLIKTEKY